MKKLFLFLLCFVLAFSFSGCGKTSNNVNVNEEQIQDQIFSDQDGTFLGKDNQNSSNEGNNEIEIDDGQGLINGDEVKNEENSEFNKDENVDNGEVNNNGDENQDNTSADVGEDNTGLENDSGEIVGEDEGKEEVDSSEGTDVEVDKDQSIVDEEKENQENDNLFQDDITNDIDIEQDSAEIEEFKKEIYSRFDIDLNFVDVVKIEEEKVGSQSCCAILNIANDYVEFSNNILNDLNEKYFNQISYVFTDDNLLLVILKMGNSDVTLSLINNATHKECSLTISLG